MHKHLKACSSKKSSVPGDLPPKIFSDYDVRLAFAEPASKVVNMIARSCEWPELFKIEWRVQL